MARKSDARTVMKWQKRMKRQLESGLSVAEFCRREAVSQGAFYYWRTKLGEPSGPDSGPRFLPVSLVAGPERAAAGGIEIDLPTGAVVRLPGDAADELVAAAIRAAGADSGREVEPC